MASIAGALQALISLLCAGASTNEAETRLMCSQSTKWNNTLAQDAGTFVAADATSPATSATGDPRGTYLPSSASDGTRCRTSYRAS